MKANSSVVARVMVSHEFEAMCEVSIASFGDDQHIGVLLDALRESWAWDDQLSFVAERAGVIVGHLLFTHAILDAPHELIDVLVLSPIGVLPHLQRQGVGTALMTHGLATIEQQQIAPLVFLEGDPTYYPQFGFVSAEPVGFRSPSERIPPAAFMVRRTAPADARHTGTLVYPDAFWRTDSVGLR